MKRKTCKKCQRPLKTCFCHCLKPIDNKWPVWILQHHTEMKHAIGTAKIAALSLKSILMMDNREFSANPALEKQIENASPVLVYPGENNLSLDELQTDAPRPLLFLDGSWRKTRKLIYEIPLLSTLPRLAINPQSVSRYRIRKEPNESAVSTLEAIVYVLSTLEHDDAKYQSLLDTMDWMINQQIKYMGEDVYRKNYKDTNQGS